MDYRVSVTARGPVFEGKAAVVMYQALVAAMTEAVTLLEREVKKRTPTGVYGAEGGLLSTIHGEVQGKGTPQVKGIVATSSPYGEVIEKGRTAGKAWPPEGVLLRWIEKKMGLDEKGARQIEFVVRRKIGRKGFPGVWMFGRGLDAAWPQISLIFDRAGFDVTAQMSGKGI